MGHEDGELTVVCSSSPMLGIDSWYNSCKADVFVQEKKSVLLRRQ